MDFAHSYLGRFLIDIYIDQGRNAQVRRVHLADGRRLRGRIFPEFTVFIPKTSEYLAQLSGRSTRAIQTCYATDIDPETFRQIY